MTTGPVHRPTGDLTGVLLLLVERVRAAGVAAGPDRVQAFVAAVDALGAGDPADVYWAGRVTLCADPLDLDRYDRVVAEVFGGRAPEQLRRGVLELRPVLGGDEPSPPSAGEDDRDGVEQVVAMNASATERLRHRDVALLSDEERAELRRLLAAFALPGELRRTRRYRPTHRGQVDRHRTVRRLLAAGGEPAALVHHGRRLRPRDVVLLVDVSGSMGAHVDALLRFAHATVRRLDARTEVFTLGTRLTRVTRELSVRDPDVAMRAVGRAVVDQGGGTRLGETMRQFLDEHGQRGLARGAVAVVLSDGWERGDVSLLGSQVERLSRLAHRVVWANPRAGREGFAPTAAGMAAALPWCDDLVAVTSLSGFEELARRVAGTTGTRPVRRVPDDGARLRQEVAGA